MKKLIFFLSLLLALPIAAQKKTFKVACLNVDGLPPTVEITGITTVKLNEEGPQEAGTETLSELIAQKGWDFFAVSENFNYNDNLMSHLGSHYNAATFRGTIPTKLNGIQALQYVELDGLSVREDRVKKPFDTDGLNLLFKNSIRISGEAMYGWNQKYGVTKNGADLLIDKGFRYYTVKIDNGLEIDVYILHMDAETSEEDNAARASQITQLVDMIIASDNKRPIIIMGDTNCRYTRDNLRDLLFKRINDDSRFEIHDPWIDFMWDGVMPELGSSSLMVEKLGLQKGEVVDKIFYINNKDADGVTLTANSYLHDEDFTNPDGSEISDHYPIVINFTIENTNKGVSAGEYYLRNVATGNFLAAGANYGTHAVVAKTGNRITLESAGTENNFYIRTTLGTLSDECWMDASGDFVYTFQPTDSKGIYTILHNGQALAADDNNIVNIEELNNTDNQLWETVSQAQLIKEMYNASENNPVDATFFIKGANFSRNDKDNDAWEHTAGKDTKASFWRSDNSTQDFGRQENFVAEFYNGAISSSNNSQWTLKQSLTGLPSGKYKLTFNGFKREGSATITVGNKTLTIKDISSEYSEAPIGDEAVNSYIQESYNFFGNKKQTVKFPGYVPNGMNGASDYFNQGYYINTIDDIIIDNGILDISISKSGNTSMTWTVIDNFVLTYYGPTAEDLAALDRVKAAIDDAATKAEEMKYWNYDNSTVEERYENRNITGDGTTEVHMTYMQLANAAKAQKVIPSDMRYAILNNSFEMGDLTEWDASKASSPAIIENSTVDGKYIYTAQGGELTQTIQVTMPGGMYELKANLSAGAMLTAGNSTSKPAAGNEEFDEVTLKFIMLNGTETIGVKCDGPFSADNFRIIRVGDRDNAASYEIVKLAMQDATDRVNAMGEPYNSEWDLSKYQEMIDNFTIEGDGMKEFNEIYGLLREKVFSQTNTDGVSYTNAIINPSFEFGSTLGWNATFSGDTGVKENSNNTYTMSGCDGSYLFNTWQENRGTVLSQTIPNLPAGHYRLRATVASDQGNYIFFDANGQRSEAIKIERAKENGQVVSFDFDVAENTTEVTISIQGGNSDGTFDDFGGNWYKVDKFELTRHGDQKVCFFYDRLQKAIDRTNQIAYTLPDKYRNQWDPSDYRDLYDRHIQSGHVDDPLNGSNGLAEIDELYSRLRALIFSQTERGANMSGAIPNFSFELGDLTSWNTNMETMADAKVTKGNEEDVYKTEGTDGEYLFNSWINGKAMPVYQTVKDVPAGKYRLSALVASDAGNRFYLAVDNTPGEMLTTDNSSVFQTITVDFVVNEDKKDILIGLYPSANGEFDSDLNPVVMGPWFKVDNFNLTFISPIEQSIEWTMEGKVYDTLILPFAADVPEGLEVYTASSTDPDLMSDEYHVLVLVPESSIEANKPYMVKRVSAGETITRSASTRNATLYTFTGVPENEENSYTHGLLTGTLSGTTISAGHVMNHDETSSYFGSVNSETEVPANHAYISTEQSTQVWHPVVYVEEPDNGGETGINGIETDEATVDVYTPTGILVRSKVDISKAFEGLDAGIYILSDGRRVLISTTRR